MSSPKVSTIIIIITGEPEGDDLEIVWDAIPFETTTNQSADSGIFRCQIQLYLWTRSSRGVLTWLHITLLTWFVFCKNHSE